MMVDRVLVTSSSIKVSKPGIDVNTALSRDLLLTIGARVGQIIGRGYFGLSRASSSAPYTGFGVYGPFLQVPHVIGFVQFTDGMVYPASGEIQLGNLGPSGFYNRFVVATMTLTESLISVTGGPESVNNTAVPMLFHYLIYRKPWQS